MKASPILVAGGAGFIGSAFARLMIASNRPIVVLDALTYAGRRDNLPAETADFQFVQGDIGDAALVGDLLARTDACAIVNFAAETHVDRSIDGPAAFVRTNLSALSVLLEQARLYWKSLGQDRAAAFRFVQVSTDEVYGSVETGESGETAPYRPNSPYAASKAGGDLLARSYFQTYGLPVLVSNGCNTYGPRQFPEKLIPLMILNALDGRALPVYGDGANQREWLHADDHCRAVAAILDHGRPGQSYNIGSAERRSNLDVVGALCAVLDHLAPRPDGRGHAHAIAFVADRPGHDFRYAVNADKLRAETGWRPQVEFVDGLRDVVRWYLAHPDWCDAITGHVYDRRRLGAKT